VRLAEIFVSRHTLHLEKQLEDVRFTHAADLDALEKRHADELAYIKESRAAELNRLLDENKRLQGEVDRIRIALGQPGTREPVVEADKPRDPDAMPFFGGSPWERIQQREQWLQTPAGKKWMEKNWSETRIPETKEKEHANSG